MTVKGNLKTFLLFFFLFLLIPLFFSFASEASKEKPKIPLNSSTDKEDKTYSLSKARFCTQVSTEDKYSFYIDYIFPLFFSQDKTTLFFFNPKKTISTPHSEELNLGIGLRKLFLDKYILGLNFFYDKKYSSNKVWHYQRGYGLEFLSEDLDLRFNYYDPISKPKTIDYHYEFGETNLLYWNNLEEPLEGFDFEFGFPLPFKKLNTRLYAGGFFYNSKLTKDKEGFRVRTETNLNKWLSLDLTLNTHHKQETEFIGAFRVTIPLELTRVLDNKNPFKTQERNYLQDRLLERVVRDIDIQTATGEQREARQEIIYVDNSNDGDASEDGSLSHPHNTLDEAFDNSRYDEGITIYVDEGDGTAADYTDNYTLDDNVVLWGSGYDGGYRGIPAPGEPIIDGDGSDVITLGNNNTVMGLTIQNGDDGIYAINVTGINIHHNTITGNSSRGIYVYTTGSTVSTVIISWNTITNATGIHEGVNIVAFDNSSLTGTLSHNTISGNSPDDNAAVLFNSETGTSLTFSVSRNIITDANTGVYIGFAGAAGDYTMDLGGGTLGSEGYNSIYDNGTWDLFVDNTGQSSPLTIYAENNWWGTTTPGGGEIWCADPNITVDYDPWLTSDPN